MIICSIFLTIVSFIFNPISLFLDIFCTFHFDKVDPSYQNVSEMPPSHPPNCVCGLLDYDFGWVFYYTQKEDGGDNYGTLKFKFKFKFLFLHIIKYIEYSVFVISCILISRIFNYCYTIQ